MFTDEHDIERELKAAIGIQPSGGFELRVLQAAAEDTRTERRGPWSWLGVAAALVVAAAGWLLSGPARPAGMDRVVAGVEQVRAMEPAPLKPVGSEPPAVAWVPVPARASQAVRQPAGPPSTAPGQPDVIVPANQLALIAAFAREMQGSRIRPPDQADPDDRLQLLVVPQMTVEPIAIATLEANGPGPGSKGLH